MKKFIAVAAMLSVMFFGFGTSQALIGVPDDVPGTDILIPFFYVSMAGHGNENTLLTITDVEAPGGYNGIPGIQNTQLHMTVYTIDSFPVHNASITLTPFDVYSDDMLRIIIDDMSPASRVALEVDTDGAPGPDHYAGYVIFFNNSYVVDHLISNIYQVFLTEGMAASYNGVSWEFDTAFIDPLRQLGIFGDEAFSANALYTGKWLLGIGAPAPVNAAWFRLMPRYFVNDDLGDSLLMIWLEANLSRAPATPWDPTLFSPIPIPGNLHCYFFNEDEDVLSAWIPLDHELNIVDVRDVLPGGLFLGYPWGGWIDITTPDFFGNGWWYPVWDPGTNMFRQADLGAYRQWAGYSWQRAVGAANEAWEVIHPMHRDAGIGAPWVPAPWW